MTATVFYDNITGVPSELVFYDNWFVYYDNVSRTVGEAPPELTCARCEKSKRVVEFSVVMARGKARYHSYCDECQNAYQRSHWAKDLGTSREKHKTYYSENKDRILANQQRYRTTNPDQVRSTVLKRYYGISIEEYQVLLTAQNGVCAICGKPPHGKRKFLSVDHDHKTGRVRGLLCTTCNVGIGALGDDPVLIRAALDYLIEVMP